MSENEQPQIGQSITLDIADDRLVTLSVKDRKLGVRIVPYDTVAFHPTYGPLMFKAGAFGDVVPGDVRLRMDHQDPPTGLGTKFWEQADGAYMEFQLSKTTRADDQLTLAVDGVSRGASVGFGEVVGRSKLTRIDGKNVTVYGPDSARLAELSTTWMPTFAEAGVMYVLNKDKKEEAPMGESSPAIEVGIDYDAMAKAMGAANASAIGEAIERVLSSQGKAATDARTDVLLAKFDEMLEQQRASFTVQAAEATRKPALHDWVQYTLMRMRGETVSSTWLKELALDDVVTTEQPGLVPNLLVPDYNDIINSARPFLSSTREITPPETGTSMLLPIITTRAVAGTQAGNAEKGALTTTATKVGTGTFAYKPVFGGADISIQMIQRAGRSFFDILTGDMGMAYALDCDTKAIVALLAGYTDSASAAHHVVDGSAFGPLDPEDPNFGVAWQNSILAAKRAPTHIWMNAQAVAAFIDAKAPMTNAPLYSNLAASFTAAGGPGGTLSGLTPVYVPALDGNLGVDVIIGPSDGFVWAEDPALNLQADVPSIAGRDIALVGGIFPAPRYANAFTTYTVTS